MDGGNGLGWGNKSSLILKLSVGNLLYFQNPVFRISIKIPPKKIKKNLYGNLLLYSKPNVDRYDRGAEKR